VNKYIYAIFIAVAITFVSLLLLPTKTLAIANLVIDHNAIYGRGCQSSNNNNSLAPINITFPGFGIDRGIVFVTWRAGSSISPELNGLAPDLTVERAGPSPSLNTSSWVVDAAGNYTVSFNGTFDDAIVCAITVNGIESLQGYTAEDYALSSSRSESPANDAKIQLMFSSSIFGPMGSDQNATDQGDNTLLDNLGNTYTVQGTISTTIAYADLQDTNSVGVDYLDDNGNNIDFANIFYEVTYKTPVVTGTPTLVGSDFSFTGTADSTEVLSSLNIYSVRYTLTGDPSSGDSVTIVDGVLNDEQVENISFSTNGLADGNYVFEVVAEAGYDQFDSAPIGGLPYHYEFEVGAVPPAHDPTITVNTGPVVNSFIDATFTADDEDGDIITRVYYTWEGGAQVNLTPVDGLYDEATEQFNLDLGPYLNGSYNLVLGVENDNAENHEEALNININNINPLADCVLSNISSPTSDATPTNTITCNSTDGIDRLSFRYYNFIDGIVQDWGDQLSLTSGSFGDNTVTAEFTPGVNLPDGLNELKLVAYTGTGRFPNPNGSELPIDVFAVEAVDDSAPTAKLNPVLPNPVADPTPYITGACIDSHSFDTNSNIANMYYRLDGGAWVALSALDGTINSNVERFSIELPAQTLAAHTINLRCVDTAGQDTNVAVTNATRNFTLVAPSSVAADEIEVSETFDTQDNADSVDSTLVWGNGYIRLRESLTANNTLINNTNYEDRYTTVSASTYPTRRYTDGRIWHAQRQSLSVYNPTGGVTTTYELDSLPGNVGDFEIFTSGGDTYAIVVSNGLSIYNLTDDTFAVVNITGLNPITYGPRQILMDTRAGLGFYVHNATANGASNLYYISLNGTPSDQGDDQFEWVASVSGADIDNISTMTADFASDVLFLGSYGTGVVQFDDNNTPLDNSDDQMMQITNTDLDTGDIDSVSALAFDPALNAVYVTDSAAAGTALYTWNLGINRWSDSDDIVVRLATVSDLFSQQVYQMKFLTGPDYVGGQLFMSTYRGDLIYYNTNGSAAIKSDDTKYLLAVAEGRYPEFIGGLEIADYNTVYANFQRQGLNRINLDRGWVTPGKATTIELPPEDRLIVNNITLTSLGNLGSIDPAGNQMPNAGLAGFNSEVSIDGGVTFQEIAVNELLFIDQEDYRFRLNFNLGQLTGERTPVIGGFTVKYAAYQDENQSVDPTLDIEVPVTSFGVNDPFTMNLEVVDTLGYVIQSYDGTVDLTLQLFNGGIPAPYLNYVTAPLVNGRATITDATISQPGEYRVLASNIQLSANSAKLVVVSPVNNVTPTMVFYSNKYVIDPGESVTLHWTTTNLDTLSLSTVGNVATSGSRTVNPTESTYYILAGTNSEADALSAGLQIIVRAIGEAGVTEPLPGEEFTSGENVSITLNVTPQEARVYAGGRVDISWVATGADDVFIDYTNNTGSPTGSLQVYPDKDLVIKITARKGTQSLTKEVRIFIVQPDTSKYARAVTVEPITPIATGILSIFAIAAVNGGIINYVAIFFGFIFWRKRKYWGIVFDVSTFNPLALVTVRIYKKGLTTKTFVAQTVTDLEGRYGINLAEAGSYTIEFIREGYGNSVKDITILKGEDVVLDVGMRGAQKGDDNLLSGIRYFWKQNATQIMQIARIGLIILMAWGLTITFTAIGFTPSLANYLVAALYIVILITQGWVLLEPWFGRKSAALIDASSKRPLVGAILRLVNVSETTKSVESLGISNAAGIIKIRAKQGAYQFMASKAGYITASGSTFIDESGKLAKPVLLEKEIIVEGAPNVTQKFGSI